MEDYKKKYEEALDNFKKIKAANKYNNELVDFIEYKYPELKESKDEMIRSFLISKMKEVGNVWKEYSSKDIIAWLEKQGENKQDGDYPKFNFDDVLALQCCMGTVKKIQEDKELYEQLQSLHDRIHDAYWLESQGEQKTEIKYIYPKFRVGDVIEPAKPNGYSVPVRVKYIGEGYYSCESDDCKSFLSFPVCDENKYVLTEQKSTWSEEDEKFLNLSLVNLTELKDRFGETYGKVGNCIDWLKSLKERYTWKPSDEQMEAFEHFVRSVGESGYASPYDNNTKLLYSLLQQLKKLREE